LLLWPWAGLLCFSTPRQELAASVGDLADIEICKHDCWVVAHQFGFAIKLLRMRTFGFSFTPTDTTLVQREKRDLSVKNENTA